jgi:probable rRNA maturation factor
MNEIELISELDTQPREFDYIEPFILSILDSIGADNWQMGLVATDDAGIREYNRRWRNIDKATDVLSFVQDDGELIPLMPGMPKEAGDIVVSLETVARNAGESGSTYDEELRRVIIHGILHLNGLDHPGDRYDSGMLKLQEELLGRSDRILKDVD